jgi:hypothetical protein
MNNVNQELNFLKPDRVRMIVEFDAVVIRKPQSGDIIMSYLPSRSGGPSAFLPFLRFFCYNQIIPSAFLQTIFSTLDSQNNQL